MLDIIFIASIVIFFALALGYARALGDDDIDAFRALVQEIAQDFDLEASVKLKPGSFSIRFSRAHADGRRMSA
jgi:hypothetical protein